MSEENKVNEVEEKPVTEQTDDKKPKKKQSRKERLDAELQGLSMKERKKLLEERKEKRRMKAYIAIGTVVVVLVAALLFWDSGVLQRNMAALNVGNKSYSAAELDYYYYSNYNNYSSYAAYYGLDTTKSLKDQEIYEGTSWYDYFRDGAKSTQVNVSILNQEAEKAGYKLSEEGQKKLDKTIQELKDTCKENGYSVSYYLKATYGEYMNFSTFKKVLSQAKLAEEYETKKKESFEQSDKDINAYYKKHAAELDTFEYKAYMLSAAPETKTDENGEAKEPTEKETKAAQKKAKEGADALQAALTAKDDKKAADLVQKYNASDSSNGEYSSFSSTPFSEWLTDKARKAGDVKVFKDESEGETGDKDAKKTLNGYYVVRFDKRYLDEYHNANYRNLLVSAEKKSEEEKESDVETPETQEATATDYKAAEKTAKDLLTKWEKNGGSEDAFAKLAEKESADENNKEDGGLNENVAKNDVNEDTSKWLFGDKRKEGDHTILKDETNTGYQLLYFQSFNDRMHWQDASVSALQDEAYQKWYEGVEKNYKDSTTFMYRYV